MDDHIKQLQLTLPKTDASKLIDTYSYEYAVKLFKADKLDTQQISSEGRPYTRIFLAIERNNQKIEVHIRAISTMRPGMQLSSGKSLLDLSLAEALFCQQRFEDAEKLCSDIQSRAGLLKFEQLRLRITLATLERPGNQCSVLDCGLAGLDGVFAVSRSS